jgi:poly(A) polymerase
VMAETGLLGMVLGGVPLLASFSNMAKLEAYFNLTPDPGRRLGALAVLVTEDAERLWERLRLTNVEHERLTTMGEGWWRVTPAIGAHGARTLLYRVGEFYTDRVLLAWSRSEAGIDDPAWRELATLPAVWTPPACPFRAAELIKRGVARGPGLGAALRAAEEAWIAADFPGDPEAIAAILDHAAGTAA